MDESKAIMISKIKASGLLKDPQWLERLDEPAPLWVVLEVIHQLMDRLEPPERPYD